MKKYKYNQSFTFDGKRYYLHANTLEELYKKKAEKIQEIKTGNVILSEKTTVDEWAKQAYSTYKPNVSSDYMNQIRLRYGKYIAPQIGSLPISKVKPVQCQEVLNECAGMSYSHNKKLMQELKFIFRTAKENQLIVKDPAENIQMPAYTKGFRRSITDTERKHLLAVCDTDPHFILFLLMLYCGCRPMEAAKCQGLDIQTRDGHHLLHIRGTKTVNSDRYVPIPAYLYSRIRNTGKFDFIAPNSAGRQHSKSSYKRLSARLRRDMNISMGCKVYRNQLIPPYPLAEDFVPYMLRHTYCTDLARAGIDVRTAQKLMGHANISITADIYTHVDDSFLMSAADVLENL